MTELPANWSVYILLCSDGSLYTGISTDVERRFRQHQSGDGAKYFRGRQPLCVVYQESGYNRKCASQREYQLKQLSRAEKWMLIAPSTLSEICTVDALPANGGE